MGRGCAAPPHPTRGSTHRARAVPPAPAAAPPKRAKCARCRGDSCRSPGRISSAGRALNQPRPARPRSSDSSRQCWSRAQPCAYPADFSQVPHPARLRSARQRAAVPERAQRSTWIAAGSARGGFRAYPGERRAHRPVPPPVPARRARPRVVPRHPGPGRRGRKALAPRVRRSASRQGIAAPAWQ
jgi:hypothetical protein